MRHLLILRSLLPFAARFFYRHPTKLEQLRQHWTDYTGRFEKMAVLTQQEISHVERIFYELECQEPLFRELNGIGGMGMHPVIYYALVRLVRPKVIVETGVSSGFSSRFLLLALERNGSGELHSIDLPNQDVELDSSGARQKDLLPAGKELAWLVPHHLRGRWQFHLGDAKELLPALLQSLGSIDIFIHDSLHTYEHMLFEFRCAWPYIMHDGYLPCDDTDWNPAFVEFAREVHVPPVMFNFRVGAIKKP